MCPPKVFSFLPAHVGLCFVVIHRLKRESNISSPFELKPVLRQRKEKLKGVQCSEPVKSWVPSARFLYKTKIS